MLTEERRVVIYFWVGWLVWMCIIRVAWGFGLHGWRMMVLLRVSGVWMDSVRG